MNESEVAVARDWVLQHGSEQMPEWVRQALATIPNPNPKKNKGGSVLGTRHNGRAYTYPLFRGACTLSILVCEDGEILSWVS